MISQFGRGSSLSGSLWYYDFLIISLGWSSNAWRWIGTGNYTLYIDSNSSGRENKRGRKIKQ